MQNIQMFYRGPVMFDATIFMKIMKPVLPSDILK